MTTTLDPRKPRLLFLCTHNANRSQMAEALAHQLFGAHVEVASAGSKPGGAVNPKAIAVLQEIGIDWSHSVPKAMNQVFTTAATHDVEATGGTVAGGTAAGGGATGGAHSIDMVVTLCSNDGVGCPFVRGHTVGQYVHRIFDDPSQCPASAGGADGLGEYRRVRDEIQQFLYTLPFPHETTNAKDAVVVVDKGTAVGAVDAIDGHGHGPDAVAAADRAGDDGNGGISFFEKYLTVWVLLCMLIGGLIGYFAPGIVTALKRAEVSDISIPIAVLLWVMIFPMLLQIDFQAVYAAVANPGPIVLTTLVNFGIQPFTMYVISLLFFRYVYTATGLMSRDTADEYLAGCILLGGAPCTAMVFVWSVLVGGDPGYTIVQVAVNDAFMLVLYLPTMLLLLSASSIPLPYDTIAISVAFFIAIPLALAIAVRTALLATVDGAARLQRTIDTLKPVCPLGLLATLILIFIYQGETIGRKPIDILLIIVPLSLQTFAIFALTFALGYVVCMDFTVLGPAALISTSNFFELAVAIAVALYGPQSGASLATVVGVLVEVPTMLCLVQLCKRWQGTVEARCRDCDEKCPQLRAFATCKMPIGGGSGGGSGSGSGGKGQQCSPSSSSSSSCCRRPSPPPASMATATATGSSETTRVVAYSRLEVSASV